MSTQGGILPRYIFTRLTSSALLSHQCLGIVQGSQTRGDVRGMLLGRRHTSIICLPICLLEQYDRGSYTLTHIFLSKAYKTFLLPYNLWKLWHFCTLLANFCTYHSTFGQFCPSSIGWQENHPQLMLTGIPHQKW